MAQADTSRALAEFRHAQRQLERVRDLHAIGIAARKELEQAETETARAEAELARAQARTLLYGSSSAINQRLTITSGITGTVVERHLNPGQELRPDQFGPGSNALFVVTDPSRLWLQIDVRENDLALIEPGKRIEFSAHAHPDRWFAAEVTAVTDAINPITRTLKVRARIDNESRLLKVEMLGRVRVLQQAREGVDVPAAAVVSRDGAHWVYVSPRVGEFQPRKIEVVYQGSDRVLVRSGLRAGEAIVIENILLLGRIYRGASEATGRAVPASRSTTQ